MSAHLLRTASVLLLFVVFAAVSPAGGFAQTTDRVAATKRMLTEGWSKHNGVVASQYFALTAVSYTNGIRDTTTGPADVKATLQWLVGRFPDMRIRPVEVRASGDHVYTRWQFDGTHKTTHRKLSIEGMNDDRWEGSTIVEERSYFDETPVLEAQGYSIKPPAGDGEPP
jgi:SnoaL-like polyketide cyclase